MHVTQMCMLFGEKFQNATRLHTHEIHTLGNMFLKYQLKKTTFGCPKVAVTQTHMSSDTNVYVWVLQLRSNNQAYKPMHNDERKELVYFGEKMWCAWRDMVHLRSHTHMLTATCTTMQQTMYMYQNVVIIEHNNILEEKCDQLTQCCTMRT